MLCGTSPGPQMHAFVPQTQNPTSWLCPAKHGRHRATMSIKAAVNRFIFSYSSLESGFYQRLAASALSLRELAHELIRYAEQAQAFRQVDSVEAAGLMLSNMPLKEYRDIGHYYLAWCEYKRGSNTNNAQDTLEGLADKAPIKYRHLSLSTLAAIEARKQNTEMELFYALESLKLSPDLSGAVEVLRGIAVVKAKEGFHTKAIKDLENLMPMAMHAKPLVLYSCLNSLATELCEVGRKGEARNLSQHVLASPFAPAYPEWLQTAEDLRPANRSFAGLRLATLRKGKLLSMPIPEHGDVEELERPARVINFQQWKKKMGKDETPKEGLGDKELMLRIFQLVSTGERTGAELYEILNAVEKVLAEHKNKIKDKDEDED